MRPLFKRNRLLNATYSDEDLSTMAVNRPLKSSLKIPSSASTQDSEAGNTKKSVTFNERRNVHHKSAANSKLSDVCWYGMEESLNMKQEAQSHANDIALSKKDRDVSYRRILSNVYQACMHVDGEHDELILAPKQQQDFFKSVSNSNTRLGLERFILVEFDYKERHKQMVETAQQMHKALGPGSYQAKMVRHSLEPLSRASRLFALEMGKAHAKIHNEN